MLSSYQETLDFLYRQLPMFSRIGSAAYKKDLTNTLALCEHFDNPQNKFRSIHIGGTNGKGSTTNYLASMFIESGKKVGIYTSPHLIDFRERIKIGNLMISQDFVVDFVKRAKPLIAQIQPSFFELTVVMAFQYFASQKVDIALIEVGLGGRLDSTNVINPLLSVITNVSFDHMNMLGHTIQEIAGEKAGIIKQNTPVVIGESNIDYNDVFERKAELEDTALIYASNQILFLQEKNKAIFKLDDLVIELPQANIEPPYQIKNIKTAILSFGEYAKLENWNNKSDLKKWIEDGIVNRTKNTGFLGRWTQIDYQQRKFILESAHNEAGIIELNHTLEQLKINQTTIIFGCVNDKDVSEVVRLLPKNFDYILTQASIPRALDVEILSDIFKINQLNVTDISPSVDKAIEIAVERNTSNEKIIVTGSIFLVGEVLGLITTK